MSDTQQATQGPKPEKYTCTLCHKVHRLSQQGRDAGETRYDMHLPWREGGPEAIPAAAARTTLKLPAPTAAAARLAVLMRAEYRALRNPRIVQVDVVGLSGSVSYVWQLTMEHERTMSAKRSHEGIAHSQGERRGPVGHPPAPSSPDPRRAVCTTCGGRVHYVRRTYGPRARAGYWQHTGDGLAQYRSWGLNRR